MEMVGRRKVAKAGRGPRKGRGGKPKKIPKVPKKGTITNYFPKTLYEKDGLTRGKRKLDDVMVDTVEMRMIDTESRMKKMKFLYGNGTTTTDLGAKSTTGDDPVRKQDDCKFNFKKKKQISMDNYFGSGKVKSLGISIREENHL